MTDTDRLAAKGLAACEKCERIMHIRYLDEGVCDDCRRPTRQMELFNASQDERQAGR